MRAMAQTMPYADSFARRLDIHRLYKLDDQDSLSQCTAPCLLSFAQKSGQRLHMLLSHLPEWHMARFLELDPLRTRDLLDVRLHHIVLGYIVSTVNDKRSHVDLMYPVYN